MANKNKTMKKKQVNQKNRKNDRIDSTRKNENKKGLTQFRVRPEDYDENSRTENQKT